MSTPSTHPNQAAPRLPAAPTESAAQGDLLRLTVGEKRLLYMLAGVQFFNIVDFMIMMPLGPMLSRTMGINTAQFGVLISSYTFAGAASGLVFALFADRFERKRLMMQVYGLFVLSTLCCALAPNYTGLLVARGLAGVFGGVLGAMVNTLVADNVAPERRGQGMGMVSTAFALSTVVGVPAALWLANHVTAQPFANWRAPFAAVSFLAMCLGFALHRGLPRGAVPKPSHTGEFAAALRRIQSVLSDRNHQIALLFAMVIMMSSFTVIPYLTLYATRNVQFPESLLWLMYLIGGGVTLFSSRRIGRWADTAGKLRVFRIMALLSAVPMLLITHVGEVPVWAYLCITTCFFIMVNGRVVPGQALIAGAANNSVRGTFMGLHACAMSLALGIASFTGGHLISETAQGRIVHFDWAGYVAVGFIALAVWLAGKVKQRG
jgi:predicted MFS family arabinose efflux permease